MTCRIPVDRGAWWAADRGVANSRIRLKRLSRHASLKLNQQLKTGPVSHIEPKNQPPRLPQLWQQVSQNKDASPTLNKEETNRSGSSRPSLPPGLKSGLCSKCRFPPPQIFFLIFLPPSATWDPRDPADPVNTEGPAKQVDESRGDPPPGRRRALPPRDLPALRKTQTIRMGSDFTGEKEAETDQQKQRSPGREERF